MLDKFLKLNYIEMHFTFMLDQDDTDDDACTQLDLPVVDDCD